MVTIPENLLEFQKTNIVTLSSSSIITKKRLANIKWIVELDRRDLYFEDRERMLLFHSTACGEDIYIQYPGKESIRENEKKRPWDFKPIIFINKEKQKDFSFYDIWNILFKMALELKEDDKYLLRILASIFYRMAFYIDHVESTDLKDINSFLKVRNDVVSDSQKPEVTNKNLYYYKPNSTIIEVLSSHFKDLNGISLEAFLYMNDLLAWNEDCKYYYRDIVLPNLNSKIWTKRTGRINNLLTHISVIGLILEEIPFSGIMQKLQRGTAAATSTEIRNICKPFII
jgi:hypothetical protein